jgi:predicted alpha/beta hydrolase family esterase
VPRQALFIQGGGAGAHDQWDNALAASLQQALGDGWDVRYPRMPQEDDPSLAAWSPAIERELAALSDGSVLVGHSVGGTILAQVLAGHRPGRRVAGLMLVAAPFVGEGGWPGDEFITPADLGEGLPEGMPVHVFHGSDDETAPPDHATLYARAIPQACVHLLAGRDHQLGGDLREVARVIGSLA